MSSSRSMKSSNNENTRNEKRKNTDNNCISLVGFAAETRQKYNRYLYQSDGEYKAYKMNRKEDTKLNEFVAHVDKERCLAEKRHSLTDKTFRAKSAHILGARLNEESDRTHNSQKPDNDNKTHVRNKEEHRDTTMKKSEKILKKRPLSSPAYAIRKTDFVTNVDYQTIQHNAGRRTLSACNTCKHMEHIVGVYQKHSSLNAISEGQPPLPTKRVRYTFTDRQVKTFLNLLEMDYCSDLPEVTAAIHQRQKTPIATKNTDKRTLSDKREKQSIEHRIKLFCEDQDTFNKEHPLLDKVKTGVEQKRFADAIQAVRYSKRRRHTVDLTRKLKITSAF